MLRIQKRTALPVWKSWLIRAIAIIIALVLNGVLIYGLTKMNPVKVYATMFNGVFGTERRIWNTIRDISMLLCIGIGLAPAFKMKFWNIGAEGQILLGGIAAAACMMYFDSLPNGLLLVVMFLAAAAAGGFWAFIPGISKAKLNINETLFTLMMNYIAIQLVSFSIMVWVPSGSSVMGIVNANSKAGWIPDLFGQKYLFNILVVAAVTVLMFVYLKYSKHGYELSVVGESENTARYIGIDVKKVIIRTMVLSGAVCGLAGFLLVSGTNHTISKSLAGGNGFTAIMVSWLAKFNPILMIVTSFLIVFLQRGAGEIATNFRLNESVADILTGVIIFFIIGCEFFINYEIKSTRSKNKEVK